MSKMKGSEYKEMVRKVFAESKNDATEIKFKYKNEVDPIVQYSTKFEMKKPQMSKTTIDYMEFASPKKERLHKKVNFQKSTIFNDNEEPPQFRPQKKQVELYIQETETRPRKKINSPTSTNPLGYTEMNIDKLRKSKNNKNRPADYDGLLQLPDKTDTFDKEEHFNPSFISSQLFTEGNSNRIRLNNTNLNKSNQYRFDKYSSYKTDHIVDLLNSKVYEKAPEQKITPKPNEDNYSTFVKEARGICFERYQDYY